MKLVIAAMRASLIDCFAEQVIARIEADPLARYGDPVVMYGMNIQSEFPMS